MARRTKRSSGNVLKPVLQAVICATGLACGVAMGSFIIYVSGLWSELGRVVGKPLDEITKMDLLFASAPFAVMVGCGWLGIWWGIRLAGKLEN
jgi:hypothetical protein